MIRYDLWLNSSQVHSRLSSSSGLPLTRSFTIDTCRLGWCKLVLKSACLLNSMSPDRPVSYVHETLTIHRAAVLMRGTSLPADLPSRDSLPLTFLLACSDVELVLITYVSRVIICGSFSACGLRHRLFGSSQSGLQSTRFGSLQLCRNPNVQRSR